MTPGQFEELNRILRDHNAAADVLTVAVVALFATHPDKHRLEEVYHHWLSLYGNDATDLSREGRVCKSSKLLSSLETALQGGFQPPRSAEPPREPVPSRH